MNFNSMIGETFSEEMGNSKEKKTGEVIGYDPMTGEPIIGTLKTAKRGWNKGKIANIVVAVAGVATVAAIAVFCIKSGVFFGPSGKVMLATVNTFNDKSHLMEALDFSDIEKSKSYTVEINGAYEENQLNLTCAKLPEGANLSVKAKFSDGEEIDLNGELTEQQLLLQFPKLSDNTYVYSYANDETGYMGEALGEESVKQINNTLLSLYETMQQQTGVNSEAYKRFVRTIKFEYSRLTFKKASAATYEVDGENRKCKAYETTITSSNVLNFIDAMEIFTIEYYGKKGIYEDKLDELAQTKEIFKKMPDMNVTFYLYKSKLACIKLGAGNDAFAIEFQGGNTRAENIDVSVNNKTVFETIGYMNGSKEITSVSILGKGVVATVEYDYKSGAYKVESKEGSDSTYVAGNLLKKGKNVTMSVEEVSAPELGTITLDVVAKVYAGAEQVEFSGEKIDVGSMSESDCKDLVEDVEKYMEDVEFDSIL